MMQYIYLRFAQAYGEGNYGGCDYNTGCGSGTTTGGLSNTGLAIAIIITLACLIIFLALLTRILRRRKKATAAQNTAKSQDRQSRE